MDRFLAALAMCFMEFTRQRQCRCLCMPNPGIGLLTSLGCGQSCNPLVCFLFVSVQLLLLICLFVSFLLFDCSDRNFFEVCAVIDCCSWKDVRGVVELLSDCCQNDFLLLRLQCIMQRRFTFKRGSEDRFGGCVGFYNGDMQVHE